MIQEDYVSFETAKLLKEKGFDAATFHDYDERGIRWFEEVLVNHNSQGGIACPTLQMAMKWLREKHNLHVDICYDDLDWSWNILSVDKNVPVEERPKFIKCGFAGNKTYQEALEEGIKYCLKSLI